MRPRARSATSRRGFSYLEACIAMVIVAVCILPGMQLMPALLASQRNVELHYQLSLMAQQKLEEFIPTLDENFVASDETASLAADGHADWWYRRRVTLSTEGPGRYARVSVRVWVDSNGNSSYDDGETFIRFVTIQANRKWQP